MRSRLFKLIVLGATIILVTNCKKYGKDFDTYFYVDPQTISTPTHLFIDGKNRGELPRLKTQLKYDNDTILNNALRVTLKSGNYKIEAKDSQGNVKCSGSLKFRSRSITNNPTKGEQVSIFSDKRIITRLSY